MNETEINEIASYGAAGLRIAALFCPVLAPIAAIASTVVGVLPEVEDALNKIEESVKGNGGVLTLEHQVQAGIVSEQIALAAQEWHPSFRMVGRTAVSL